MPMTSPYASRRVALATRHDKHLAIAPPFAARLDAQVVVADVDTDALGTFTGETPREGTPEASAERKARLGMAQLGCPLGVASEGSYGPDPRVPFIAGGVELLTFVDDERGLVVHEQMAVPSTNFAHRDVTAVEALVDWLPRVGFPDHALIVRPVGGHEVTIAKGIRDPATLARAVRSAREASPEGLAHVATDMRAHCNPTRMASIAQLAERLAERLACACPHCASPGFGFVRLVGALPCRSCGAPTARGQREQWACAACHANDERPRRDGGVSADPDVCPRCNP